MKDKKPWLLAILVIFGLTACATMQSDVKKEAPLTKDVNIIPQGSSAFTAIDVSFKGSTKKLFGDFETLTGKLTKPQGGGPFPAVVLMHGCGGINKFHQSWADKLAGLGYVALVLDSFGPRGEKAGICADPMRIPFNVRAQDAYDAKTYLGGLPFVDRNWIAVIGFSHGGATVLSVVNSPKQKDLFRAAIAFYPYCQNYLGDSNAPLLILAGALDDWCPAALCQKNMPSGKTAREITLKIYPGAYHGFDMEGMDLKVQGHRILYNSEATADSIVQVKEFLAKYLK
jgi:dienelactone hydrolase